MVEDITLVVPLSPDENHRSAYKFVRASVPLGLVYSVLAVSLSER